MFRFEFLAVEKKVQPAVEAGVVPHPALDKFVVEIVFAENLIVGQKLELNFEQIESLRTIKKNFK